MMLTRSNFLIGSGPKPRLDIEDREVAEIVQLRWCEWCRMVNFNWKLTSAITAMPVDGESFIVEINNPRLPEGTPLLDYRVLEAEYVHARYQGLTDMSPRYIDGIMLDDNGYPIYYDVSRYHPGDSYNYFQEKQYSISSRNMIHLKREDRPGQVRGIPWMVSALPTFAQFRRFTIATLTAAEAAANAAGVVYTDSSALNAEDMEMPDEDIFNLQRGSFPVLPAGWDMKQIASEHPTATFDMFRRCIISEISRCLNMPLNIALANSENHNYASGRLDHQIFQRSIMVERKWIEDVVLGRVFQRWLNEATLLPGYLPEMEAYPDAFSNMPVRWYWDAMPHVDPEKEANAAITRWEAGLLTDEDFWFEQVGRDPEVQYRKLAEQQARREEIGLPVPSSQASQPAVESPA